MAGLFRRTRDPYAVASNRHDRPSDQVLRMAFQDFSHDLDSSLCRQIRKSDEPAVRRSFQEDKLTEVLVHSYQGPVFSRSPIQHRSIPWVRTSLPGFYDIVSLLTQPLRQSMTRAPVNKEFHLPVTPTASRESCVMTACA